MDNNLEFTVDKYGNSLNFLDMNIYKKGNYLKTDICYKDLDTKLYLNCTCSYDRYVKHNIPLNLARRIYTLVSEEHMKRQRLN